MRQAVPPIGRAALAIGCIALLGGGHLRNADERLLDRVITALKQHRLITQTRCIVFVIDHDEEPGFDEVDLRERHDATCGGDPAVEPRRFSVRIDRATGRMETDVRPEDRANATMSPLN